MTTEEFSERQKQALSGKESDIQSKNTVESVPQNFTSWMKENKTRIDRMKSKPYFVRDNKEFINLD